MAILVVQGVCSAEESGEAYRITSGDKLEASVFDVPELTAVERTVDAEGNVNLPLIEKIRVVGKTVSEAEQSIAKAYRTQQFIKKPQVTVTVTSYKAQTVSILGAVGKEGLVIIPDGQKRIELLAAIAAAGGFQKIANIAKVEIIRAGGGKDKSAKVNVKELTNQKSSVYLYPGDVVKVRQRWL